MTYTAVLIAGAVIGWLAHKVYLRGIYKTIKRLRRKLVGR